MILDDLGKWRRTHYTKDVTPEKDGEQTIIFGWIHEIRDLGKLKFIVLRDREGTVQITIRKNEAPRKVLEKIEKIRRESVIGVKGTIKHTMKAKRRVEILPNEIKVLNIAKVPLPIDTAGRIPASLDKRLDARILDLRISERIAIFKLHHTALSSIRSELTRKGFIEVFTPKILATATEGGAALFPVEYFGKKAYLAQSPQLYKEALTAALERVFEIAQYYRAEESNTSYHLNEFISIDIEAAFMEAEDVMEILEDLIVKTIRELRKKHSEDLERLNPNLESPKKPFKRITYDKALEILEDKGVEIEWGEDINTQGNRVLGEEFKEPYFIVKWPRKLKPFYIKPLEKDPEITDSFDLNWSWLELASGGTRIHDKEELIGSLIEKGLNPESFKPFLTYYDYGMPPHSGWGWGFQRFLMMVTGRRNIREVTLFPRDRDRIVP
ncbi:MAG: aspartate--tRNA(Asn) ligase [archaeon GB-1867-097]|nr:aspartate--tRNA(Asn) ligase [Candidatus Culexmicrobium thermophilum]MCS7384309.1 aspartate--tRNA(Asn) ligase [Candidatus Culexmicrobium thermophilum]HDO21060.1 aspartate--tRNA(Asn) ligase [Candidatus Bathyarchaeota archaeon]